METTEKLKTTPKDFFIHLGVLVALYISVVSILTLIFSIIDQVYPKEFGYTDPYAGGVSLAMAMLIVAFPLCVLFTRALSKEEMIVPEKRNLWARKAITYCTLFIAIVVVAIDLIVLLNSFFSGEEITLSFALKVLFIILVIGSVAGYYLYDLRRKPDDDGERVQRWYAYGSAVAIVVAFSFGFYVMGSPASQKQKRYDTERISSLQTIQYQIISYWQAKRKLPATLDEMNDPLSGVVVPRDPKTQTPYDYITKGKLSFQLCANFERDMMNTSTYDSGMTMRTPYPYKGGVNENWQHGIGRVCFDRTIDPEFYPPANLIEKPVPSPAFIQ
ncbi:MAG: DUF5671 domain-containing protein [bacterium]|nr:DUF5671 domain-containing protein [bacterium]